MSYVSTKSKFHVALDGVGLLLQGAPDRLAYDCKQAPIYNARFSGGDRSYTDFSFWWFFAQTDWSGGIKDTVSWADDAMYYWSTNINAWDEIGGISLSRSPVLDEDFTEDIYSGCVAEVAGTNYQFIGTNDASGDSRPNLYRASIGQGQTWTEIIGTNINANKNVLTQLYGRNGALWILAGGTGQDNIVTTYDGASFVTQDGHIVANCALAETPTFARCGCEYQGTNYVFVDSNATSFALVSTTKSLPTLDADWTKVLEKTTTAGLPVDVMGFNGSLLYLVNYSGYMELRQWDITNSVDTLLRRFDSSGISGFVFKTGGKFIKEKDGKAIITVPSNEVWELTAAGVLTRIFLRDTFKTSTLSGIVRETSAYLDDGCVLSGDKLWWGNLMYDGARFYNTWKDASDSTSVSHYPVYADNSGNVWYTGSGDQSKLYYIDLDGTSYKGTADKNYLVFSNFDLVSGLDKLAYSATILFKPLASGQSIVVEYYLGEMAAGISWTALGTASFSVDGASVRDKTFIFPVATTFKKIWFRVKLNGGGSDTPTLNDLVMNYLPIPAYKKQWTLNTNMGDEVKRLDGGLVETTGRELKSRLERAWWTKSVLDFQDFDYATTLLDGALTNSATTVTVDSPYDFAEQGRFRVDDEEMTYTGKTPTTFTGVTRGTRDTRAVAHLDNAVLNNAYKVIVTELQSKVPIALQDKEMEYTVGIFLREV